MTRLVKLLLLLLLKTAFRLFLHFLTSLIISCLSLFFGTWGRPVRLNCFSLQEAADTEGSVTRKAMQDSDLFQQLVNGKDRI